MAALGMVDERLDPVRMPVATPLDLVAARRRGPEMALALDFPLPDATQVAAVISEFCRQVIFHGGGGMLTLVAQGVNKNVYLMFTYVYRISYLLRVG